jgi:hypothetical protein
MNAEDEWKKQEQQRMIAEMEAERARQGAVIGGAGALTSALGCVSAIFAALVTVVAIFG